MKKRDSAMRLCVAALAGYLAGTVPTADIVTRYAANREGTNVVDLRRAGTGNPGALNAAKTLGWKWGAVVLAGDAVKGAVAAAAGRVLAGDNGAYAAGSGAVVGHCAPVWSGFSGGKGLATSAGTSLVCFPAYMPIDLGLAAATLALSRGRASTATYVASAVFVAASVYWWRAKKGNLWGPRATAGLPLYALCSSAIIAYRFLTAPSTPVQIREADGLAAPDSIEPESVVAS